MVLITLIILATAVASYFMVGRRIERMNHDN